MFRCFLTDAVSITEDNFDLPIPSQHYVTFESFLHNIFHADISQ